MNKILLETTNLKKTFELTTKPITLFSNLTIKIK